MKRASINFILLAVSVWGQMWTPGFSTRLQIPRDSTLKGHWTAESIIGVADAGTVAAWTDQSGNGNTASQATEGNKPTYVVSGINGRPVVSFVAASSQFLAGADSASLQLTAPFSAYAVVQQAANSDGELFDKGKYRFGNVSDKLTVTLPGLRDYNTTPVLFVDHTDSVPRVVGYEFSGTAGMLYLNGLLKETETASNTLTTSNSAFWIGSVAGASQFWGGRIAEIAIYSGIDTARRKAVFDAWCTKYKITCSRASEDADVATASHPADPLTIPTYDTSGQTVHPSVLYVAAGWSGHTYWQANTPFPDYDETKERPSIWYSDDNSTWTAPDTGGGNNLIDTLPTPNGGTWSDPDILLVGSTMYCFYREFFGATSNAIYYKTSTNGTTWSARTLALSVGTNTLLSPSIVYDGTQWIMYTVSGSVGLIYRRTASAPNGTWSDPVQVSMAWPTYSIWTFGHFDVLLDSGLYYMILGGMGELTDGIHVATSRDGIRWQPSHTAFLKYVGAPTWCSNEMYRPTIQRMSAGTLGIWYSGRVGSPGSAVWKTGYTTISGL
jgi:hypothetical protein